jgi:hypothetical protein
MILSRIALDGLSAKFIFVDLITVVLILWLGVQEIAKKSKSGHLPAKGSFFIFYLGIYVVSQAKRPSQTTVNPSPPKHEFLSRGTLSA